MRRVEMGREERRGDGWVGIRGDGRGWDDTGWDDRGRDTCIEEQTASEEMESFLV
jgi:hypothetical protein